MSVDFSFVSTSSQEEIKDEILRVKQRSEELSYQSFVDAIVIPASTFHKAGIIDKEGNDIHSSTFHELGDVRKMSDDEIIENRDETVIFIGILHNVWGHCLTDALKKFWFLKTSACRMMLANGIRIVYLPPDKGFLKNHSFELYKLAGVDVSQLEPITKVTRFREVIIPDNSLVCSYSPYGQWVFSYFKEYVDVIHEIGSSLSGVQAYSTYEKVYLTRTGIFTDGREYGEKSIERVFRKKGFKVISPEKHNLAEQYYILSHCKELAVTEGSVSHSAIFCRPRTKVYLLRKSYYVNGYQSIINEIADLDVTYIDAHHSLPEMQYGAMYGPFYMCITPELERFVGHKLFHLPLWMRPSWWWYCNRNRKIVHLINRLIGKE